MHMIVIGADPHKSQHTLAAVEAATAELLDDLTVAAKPKGHAELLRWGRSLGSERLWASSVSGRWRTAGTSRAPSSGF